MPSNPNEAAWSSFEAAEDDSSLDIWGFIRRRKSFVIVLSLIGVGVGYLLFQQQTPRYESSAMLKVIDHSADKHLQGLIGERTLEDAEFEVISPMVLGPAYDNARLGELETLRGFKKEEALQEISEHLEVELLSANIFELLYQGPNPADTSVITNAIAQAYVTLQESTYSDATAQLKSLLLQVKDELHEDIKEADKTYAKFRMESRLLTDGSNKHQEELQGVRNKLSQVVIQQTEIKSNLMSLEEALRSGGPQAGLREALMLLVGKDSDDKQPIDTDALNAMNMAEILFPLLMEEAVLAQQVGGDHPKLTLLRKRIEITRNHLDKLAGLSPADGKPRSDFLTVYIQSLREEAKMLERTRTELEGLANQTETEARKLLNDHIENQRQLANKERLSKMFETVVSQIGETQVNTSIGGITAQTLSSARHGELVYPILPIFLGIGGVLGAMMGVGLGYVVEMADHSFRKPEDIVREFGVPIVGHIPYMNEKRLKTISDDVAMDRTVITAHLPRSRPAEAYRSVRTAICFSAVGNKHRIIQVTSPTAGDGKSTLAVNLAVALAQSGKKTVLVESDFRRPKVHKVTGVNNKCGIVDVLRGEGELADAIKSTEVEDFFVLPCGSHPRNPSELLTRPEYESLLQVLRQKFEYVVVDTPPVLVVTDPCSVAPRADAVIVCMRLSRHTRDFGRRTMEQLREVGANIAGVSINGVDESDAYGYGNYNYSDYKNYYRGYNYSDYTDEREGYFSEEKDARKNAPLLSSTADIDSDK